DVRISASERVANYVILVGFALLALAPIITVAQTALRPETPADAETDTWIHLENFSRAWVQGRFSEYLTNSVIVALIVVVVATVFATIAGYAFGAFEFPGSQLLFYLFLLGIMVPAEAIVVPLFYDFQLLGLTDTIWAIVLPQIAQSIAFGTFWMREIGRAH